MPNQAFCTKLEGMWGKTAQNLREYRAKIAQNLRENGEMGMENGICSGMESCCGEVDEIYLSRYTQLPGKAIVIIGGYRRLCRTSPPPEPRCCISSLSPDWNAPRVMQEDIIHTPHEALARVCPAAVTTGSCQLLLRKRQIFQPALLRRML